MAKQKELTPLKKGSAKFNLVGKAKVGEFTFKTDMESQKSDWVYNQLNLGVDCGIYGTIYSEMMGGYGSDRDNVVWVHGKKEDGKDDFENSFTIDWEDRFDKDIIKTLGDLCFITVGIEKDEKGNTIYEKFLTPYDAIAYMEQHLEDGMVVNIKGSLKYQEYNGVVSVKKEINSIALSTKEEEDFKATFEQTLLVDKDAIGKLDKETMTLPIVATIVDRATEFDGRKIYRLVNGKRKEGISNFPLVRVFDIEIDKDNKDKSNRFISKFKAKPKTITEITVEGYFTRGNLETVEVSEDDIPDDILELIEDGILSKEEILSKIAFSNGNRKPETMIISKPSVKVVGNDEDGKLPQIQRFTEKYTEDDINPMTILEYMKENGLGGIDSADEGEEEVDDTYIDDNEDEDIDEDWLADLD